MEHVRRVYDTILANEITQFFAAAIIVILVFSILARLPGLVRLFGAFNRSGATVLTTLGVLGTFVGIFLGLLAFDVANIDASVPKLLEGLKIAFSTSILGMAAAILLKIFQAIVPAPSSTSGDVTPDVIHATLLSINESIETAARDQRNSLDEVRQAISADSDGSLLTQVQKLRTTIQDGQEEFILEFREFAHTMAENNSNALIEALEHVIRDFNAQLNEQFGENFKHLNQAVGALLTWQENYKGYIETTEKRIEATVTGLAASEASIREVAAHTERIPVALQSMESILGALLEATEDLQRHLEAVAALKDKAVEAFPIIDSNLKKLTDEFASTVRRTLEDSSSAFQLQKEGLVSLQGGYEQMLSSSTEAQGRFSEAIDRTLIAMQSAINEAMQGHAQTIEATAAEMRKQVEEAWTQTQDAVTEQFGALDKGMQDELTRALEVLGRNLASLSEKFVEDYEPLTLRLREVVQMAGRV